MKNLYPFQKQCRSDIYAAWNAGYRAPILQLATGGGKTVIFSSILGRHSGWSVVIAHRREILSQIALALADNNVFHNIVAPRKTVRFCMDIQRQRLDRSWVNPNARVGVASVDTLLARRKTLKKWASRVTLWVQDEAHHMLADNKWGKVIALFLRAKGLGVSATPGRADGRSLHLSQGGCFDYLCEGPPMRQLINDGYLSDYRIFAPPSSIHTDSISVTASGDFNRIQLAQASKNSFIVGDVVSHYLKLTPGARGVTFMTDVETAKATEEKFRLNGVPAKEINAKSPDKERAEAVRDLERGELRQLVNVDLFGEGFDLPAIEVVIFGRPTWSFNVYSQQFGRGIRSAPGKTYGIIIDAVDNIRRHGGPPDKPRDWSLIREYRMKNSDENELPFRTCEKCFRIWEGYSRICPHCGHKPEPKDRGDMEQLEGDLVELNFETLSAMRNEINRVDSEGSAIADRMRMAGMAPAAINGFLAKHRKRKEAQGKLREMIALWGGRAKSEGLTDSERYVKFFRKFKTDVLTAQTLGRTRADELRERVRTDLDTE